MYRPEEDGNGGQICPCLGRRDDPETTLSYPSPENHCHRAKPAAPIRLEHQRSYCLTATHSECRVFQNDPGFPLPSEIKYHQLESAQRKRSKILLWVILPALVIMGFILWQSLSRGLFRFTSREYPTGEAVPILLTGTAELTPALAPTLVQDTSTPTFLLPSPSPTWTVVTSTPIVVPFHALETPIGIKYHFIIHRVLEGESLKSISNHFRTTAEAIQSVNYSLPIPLRIDSLIIIPINQTDVNELPAFEAFMVKEDIPVEQLAQQQMVDPGVFKYYNGLQDGQLVPAGAWVLVPHKGTATPPH